MHYPESPKVTLNQRLKNLDMFKCIFYGYKHPYRSKAHKQKYEKQIFSRQQLVLYCATPHSFYNNIEGACKLNFFMKPFQAT